MEQETSSKDTQKNSQSLIPSVNTYIDNSNTRLHSNSINSKRNNNLGCVIEEFKLKHCQLTINPSIDNPNSPSSIGLFSPESKLGLNIGVSNVFFHGHLKTPTPTPQYVEISKPKVKRKSRRTSKIYVDNSILLSNTNYNSTSGNTYTSDKYSVNSDNLVKITDRIRNGELGILQTNSSNISTDVCLLNMGDNALTQLLSTVVCETETENDQQNVIRVNAGSKVNRNQTLLSPTKRKRGNSESIVKPTNIYNSIESNTNTHLHVENSTKRDIKKSRHHRKKGNIAYNGITNDNDDQQLVKLPNRPNLEQNLLNDWRHSNLRKNAVFLKDHYRSFEDCKKRSSNNINQKHSKKAAFDVIGNRGEGYVSYNRPNRAKQVGSSPTKKKLKR